MFPHDDGFPAAARSHGAHRPEDAKKADTRARRIEKYVAMLAKGEKLSP